MLTDSKKCCCLGDGLHVLLHKRVCTKLQANVRATRPDLPTSLFEASAGVEQTANTKSNIMPSQDWFPPPFLFWLLPWTDGFDVYTFTYLVQGLGCRQ